MNTEKLLQCVTTCVRNLLTADDFEAVLKSSLQDLGRAAGVDRVYIFENHLDPHTGELLTSQRFEWADESVAAQIDNPALQNIPYQSEIPNWYPRLSQGLPVLGWVRDLADPERSVLESQGILSVLVVPIRLHNQFWGFIGFDDCHQQRAWRQEEILILEAAAASVGALIQRREAEQILRRSENQLRRQATYLLALQETSLGLLSQLDLDQLLETISARAALLAETDHATVLLLTPNQQEAVLRIGLGKFSQYTGSHWPLDWSQPTNGMESGSPLVVPDYASWPGRQPEFTWIQSLVVFPLFDHSRHFVGFLAIACDRQGCPFQTEELDILKRFAQLAQVAIQNANLYSIQHLELAEKQVLLKEIHHRVKNNLQTVISLIGLQANRLRDTHDQQKLVDLQTRIRSMAIVHEHLYQGESLALVDLDTYLKRLVEVLQQTYSRGQKVDIKVDVDDVVLDLDRAIPCGLIINELVTNALKYAFQPRRNRPANSSYKPGIEILIRYANEDKIILAVCDNGTGLPEGFQIDNVESLGLQLVTTLTKQLRGNLEVISTQGACFRMTFAKTNSKISRNR